MQFPFDVLDKSLFIRNSPILNQKLAQKATQAHRNSDRFYIGDNLIEKYQEQIEEDKNKNLTKKRVLSLDKRRKFSLPTNRFKSEELTLWLFKDLAEDYGNFLKDKNIKQITIYLDNKDYINHQGKPYANQLWLDSLGCSSNVSGDHWSLDCANRVRGVLESCEAGAKNLHSTKLPYTNKRIEQIAQSIRDVKEGKKGTSRLEKALSFLEGIKLK